MTRDVMHKDDLIIRGVGCQNVRQSHIILLATQIIACRHTAGFFILFALTGTGLLNAMHLCSALDNAYSIETR